MCQMLKASIAIEWFLYLDFNSNTCTQSEKLNSQLWTSCGIAYFRKLDQTTVKVSHKKVASSLYSATVYTHY